MTDLVWPTIAFSEAGSLCIGDDQRRIRWRADRIADRGKLVLAAPGHRPFQIGVALVMRGEIFGDELAGETGGAIDDDVEFRRRHITEFRRLEGYFSHRKRQAGMIDQALDQLCAASPPPASKFPQERPAYRAAGRSRIPRSSLRSSHSRDRGRPSPTHGPGGHRGRWRHRADHRGRSRALPSTALRPAWAHRGRSFRCLRPSRSLALASPFSPAPVSTISS